MAQISRSGDLTSGPMLQKIILFSLPLAASSILQLLFNAADVVVVGRFAGSTALAAVGSNGALINLLVNLFVGLSLGANVVAARCFGENIALRVVLVYREHSMPEIFHQIIAQTLYPPIF